MSNVTPALRPVDGHVRALCCECGEVRLIPAGYRGRLDKHWTAEGNGPRSLADRQARGIDLALEPFWRCTVDVQCKPCGTLTRHAWLRDHDPYADWVEERNRLGAPRPS